MSPDLALLLLIGGPALLLMILRVNASLVFLSTCLGAVLIQLVGTDANDFFNMFFPSVPENNLKLGLLLLPVVLTTVFMIKSVDGAKMAFNILPALGTGFLLAILIVPLMPGGQAYAIQQSQAWELVEQLQAGVIGACALLCLLSLWMQRPKHHSKHKKPH